MLQIIADEHNKKIHEYYRQGDLDFIPQDMTKETALTMVIAEYVKDNCADAVIEWTAKRQQEDLKDEN